MQDMFQWWGTALEVRRTDSFNEKTWKAWHSLHSNATFSKFDRTSQLFIFLSHKMYHMHFQIYVLPHDVLCGSTPGAGST